MDTQGTNPLKIVLLGDEGVGKTGMCGYINLFFANMMKFFEYFSGSQGNGSYDIALLT